MLEFRLDEESTRPGLEGITVIGIGGAGANVIDHLALETLEGVGIIAMNCDVRALNGSMSPRKIQLGRNLTQGLGCGGDPELGLEASVSSADEIRTALEGSRMVFICTGLGGGTGSGAAPMVARLAREAGAFVVVFATMPFVFEGKRRMKQATVALDELRRHSNALVTFDNDRMGELILPTKGITEAFEVADRVIGQSIRAVTGIVNRRGLIRIGMDDLMTALRNADSRCLFGFGQAKGESRAVEALEQALRSPLLDRGQMLEKAGNVLVHVCGGPSMTLFEIETLMRELNKHIGDDAHILFGAASDPSLGDNMSVTIITSLSRPLPSPALAGVESAPAASLPAAPPSLIAAALSSRTQPVPMLPVAPRVPVMPANFAAPASSTVTTATTNVPTLKLDARLLSDLTSPLPVTRPRPPESVSPAPAPVPVPVPVPVKQVSPIAVAAIPTALPAPDLFGDALPPVAVSRPKKPSLLSPVAVKLPEPEPEPVAVLEPEPEFEEEEIETPSADEETIQEDEQDAELEPAAPQDPVVQEEADEEIVAEYEEETETVSVEEEPEDYIEEEAAPEPEPEPIMEAPPARVVRKFDLKDILVQRQQAQNGNYAAPTGGNGSTPARHPQPDVQQVPARPAPQRPAVRPEPVAAHRPSAETVPAAPSRPIAFRPVAATTAARPVPVHQQTFDERLERASVGHFEKGEPTVEEGEDLDVPTFLRRKR